jgi:hypothetical protein
MFVYCIARGIATGLKAAKSSRARGIGQAKRGLAPLSIEAARGVAGTAAATPGTGGRERAAQL